MDNDGKFALERKESYSTQLLVQKVERSDPQSSLLRPLTIIDRHAARSLFK